MSYSAVVDPAPEIVYKEYGIQLAPGHAFV
jgi:hypothetical protein